MEAEGYRRLPITRQSAAWVEVAFHVGKWVARNPAQQEAWLRHGDTWFVGVDALPTAQDGSLEGVPLPKEIRALLGTGPLHPAQLSVTYPGYPKQDAEESAAAHRFRINRDAAHVDGLLPVGSQRRRMLREPHRVILGIALNDAGSKASPLVVWPGSHRVIGTALTAELQSDPETWADTDLSEAYQTARREVFASCPRLEVPLRAGEAVVLHRHMLHGVAPWAEKGPAENGRMVAYFRPQFARIADWVFQAD